MGRYWGQRLLETLPLLLGVSLLAFTIFFLAPGDPVALVADPALLSESERAAVREELGLNDPFPIQWGKMMLGLVNGDLRSFKSRQPTYRIIADAFPVTFIVTALGLGLATLVAVPLGTLAARRPGGLADRGLSVALATTLAFPPFLLGLLLVRLLTEEWRLLPGSGIGPPGQLGFHAAASLPYLVMPTLVVAAVPAAILARYLRDALQQVLAEDYIRTARSKGLHERSVVLGHAVRNSLIGVLGVLSTIVPVTLGGAVIVERVFGLPGLGKVTVDAALARDYPVVLTNVLFSAVLILMTNLIVDLFYGVLDPRIRLE
jgi:peptide/nickel transport system permease protein